MQDLGATAIACTPSYLLHIGEVAEKMGVDIKKDTKLRTGVLGAEPWTDRMRTRIEDWLGIKAYDIYGTSELSGPMFTECTEQKGFHIWSDLALVEIIDPGTGESLGSGEKGELTITMLQKEALPMIRYRIGDITVMDDEVCACGRTHPRIQRIQGRVDDMLVRVELSKGSFSDKITDIMKVRQKVEHRLRNSLNVNVSVELVEPGSLPRFEGKAKRVIDKRSL
jgi:phenylacetate-CoA ligase